MLVTLIEVSLYFLQGLLRGAFHSILLCNRLNIADNEGKWILHFQMIFEMRHHYNLMMQNVWVYQSILLFTTQLNKLYSIQKFVGTIVDQFKSKLEWYTIFFTTVNN